ncbi:hypothetical protein ACET3Z_018524 [Daucus carota]
MSTDGQFSEVGEARTKIQCAKIGLKYIYKASNINVNQVEKPCSPANVPSKIVEIIKYKGFQVVLAEISALLLTHPTISDAAVVPMIDEKAGEVPVAFVMRLNGFTTTEEEIKQFVSK